jgi:hypothetical protein
VDVWTFGDGGLMGAFNQNSYTSHA